MAEVTAALASESVVREFGEGDSAVRAVNEVTVNIAPGEFVALVGRSGSGKTTLLNLLAGLDRPSSGKVWFEGRELSQMPERELVGLRRDRIGFVFQSFGLIPLLSAFENVELPLHIAGMSWRDRRRRANEALDLVGPYRPLRPSPLRAIRRRAAARRHRPAPWSPTRPCSSRTNPPASSTASPDRPSAASCATSAPVAALPSSPLPTICCWPTWPTAASRWPTGASLPLTAACPAEANHAPSGEGISLLGGLRRYARRGRATFVPKVEKITPMRSSGI